MLNAAVIGTGSMGNNHVRVYREMIDDIKLVGVVDQNSSTAAKVGARFSVPSYTDVESMLDTCRPDLVSLAVPTSLHYQVGMQLIERGIHVLMEKPIASTVEEGRMLVEAAKKAGVILAVGHIERFNPAVRELERRLRAEDAGPIYKIHAQRLSTYPPRIRDAGVIIDLASHDLDLFRWLVRDEVVRIYGETHHNINSNREDMFNGLIRFRSGTVGVLDVNWITPTKVRTLSVTGARGMFICNLLSQELTFYENGETGNSWDSLKILHGVSEGTVIGIRIPRQEPLVAELTDFVRAVREQRQPMVTGQDGLETLCLALEFVRSGTKAEIISDQGVFA